MCDHPRMCRASIVLIPMLTLLFGAGCADQLLLYPSTRPTSMTSAQRREIDDRGRIVEAFVAESPGAKSRGAPEAYALEFTGNATRAEYVVDYIAKRWGDRPIEVWVMNYPGFGGSTGPATLRAIPSAALATYDALAKQAGDKPVLVAGSSLGTAAALYVAANRPVPAVVLQNPPPLQRMIMQKYGWIFP